MSGGAAGGARGGRLDAGEGVAALPAGGERGRGGHGGGGGAAGPAQAGGAGGAHRAALPQTAFGTKVC